MLLGFCSESLCGSSQDEPPTGHWSLKDSPFEQNTVLQYPSNSFLHRGSNLIIQAHAVC